MLATPAKSAVVPEIRFTGEREASISIDELKQTRKKGVIKVGDIGVFRSDKLIDWVSREESIGLAWLTDHVEHSVISFPCSDQGAKVQKSTFQVEYSSTKISPVIAGDSIKIKADIDARGILNETGCNLNLSKPENIKRLEAQIKKQIQQDIAASWKIAQEMKADVFGFGEKINIRNPRKWKQLERHWPDKLQEVELASDIRVKVRRTGMINDSFSSVVKQ